MLEFEVNGQRLRLKGNLYVVAESIDYLKARFSFSADWDGAAKTAIFKTADRKGVYNVILDENGICTVPSEVIHAPRFYVSVFGGSRITANEVEVQCNVSGYAEGSAPDTPTPEIYEQILAEINKKVSKVDGMGLSENSYTTEEKEKLSGIAVGAEVNVRSDWNQTNTDADDYIKNKPTKLSQFENDSGYTTSADLSSLSSGLSQGITNVSTALSNHQSAAVLPHADGSVTTAKLAKGAVTKEKIADDVLFSKKYDDLTNIPTEFPPAEHSHTVKDILDLPSYGVATQSADGLMSAADKKKLDGLSEGGGGSYAGELVTVNMTSYDVVTNSETNTFEMNITCDTTIEQNTAVFYALVDNCGVISELSESAGALYGCCWLNSDVNLVEGYESSGSGLETKLNNLTTTYALHWNGTEWEQVKRSEISEDYGTRISNAEERITALENTVGTANDTLAALFSEGV